MVTPAREFTQLRTLAEIADGHKLSVDAAGFMTLEEQFTGSYIWRRARWEGIGKTTAALDAFAVAMVQVVLDAQRRTPAVRMVTGLPSWASACADASRALRCLARTYRNEDKAEVAERIDRVCNVIADCGTRLSALRTPALTPQLPPPSPLTLGDAAMTIAGPQIAVRSAKIIRGNPTPTPAVSEPPVEEREDESDDADADADADSAVDADDAAGLFQLCHAVEQQAGHV